LLQNFSHRFRFALFYERVNKILKNILKPPTTTTTDPGILP
jgi:hypothetical protein